MSEQRVSELFLNNIYVLPLWVKQVIYLKTKEKLTEELAEFLDLLNPEKLMQHYVPVLTFKGKRELEKRDSGLPENFYIFLSNCAYKNDLFEITLSNYWTMAETSKVFVRCVELELVDLHESDKTYAIAQFLAGKIRTGEVLKKLGKIDITQLEKSIREQKERQSRGEKIKIADCMISLGYITDKDVKVLLAFKEESRKRFIMGMGLSFIKADNPSDQQKIYANMQRQMKKLDQENKILKNRLRKILNIQE